MSNEKPPSPKSSAKAEREKRLAEALRANLRKRKAAAKSGLKSDKHGTSKHQGPGGRP